MKTIALALLTTALSLPALADAAVIYPVNNASILSGSRFDIKVEFDAKRRTTKDAHLTINGKDAAETLGLSAHFTPDEEGKGSALILRNAHLPAGKYTVRATGGGEEKALPGVSLPLTSPRPKASSFCWATA